MKFLTVTSPDINNGTGCRVTLWVSGCSHHCKNCQNKHTWLYDQGKDISEAYGIVSEILDKDYIQGLTLSGGDPLSQSNSNLDKLHEFVLYIKMKYPEKDIWIYAGETFEEAIKNEYKKRILSLCDVMVDGMFEEKLKDSSLPFRGSSNQRVIDLNETFNENKIVIKEV